MVLLFPLLCSYPVPVLLLHYTWSKCWTMRLWREQKLCESQLCQSWICFCLKLGLQGKKGKSVVGGGIGEGESDVHLSRTRIAKWSHLPASSLQRVGLRRAANVWAGALTPQQSDWPQELIRKNVSTQTQLHGRGAENLLHRSRFSLKSSEGICKSWWSHFSSFGYNNP